MHIRNEDSDNGLRVLLVEDEDHISKLMSLNLRLEGYEVVTANNGEKAIQIFGEQSFNIIILDIMLPDISGFQICEYIRLKDKEVGIIFVSAKDAAEDKIKGLKLGADDYLTKPFNLEELLLRVNNLAKRSSPNNSISLNDYHFGTNYVNFVSFEAKGQDGSFVLTNKEAMLLQTLIENEGKVVSRKYILQHVWGYDIYPSTRTIDNFLMAFRKYFEPDPKSPIYFHSIRGVGYKFTK